MISVCVVVCLFGLSDVLSGVCCAAMCIYMKRVNWGMMTSIDIYIPQGYLIGDYLLFYSGSLPVNLMNFEFAIF